MTGFPEPEGPVQSPWGDPVYPPPPLHYGPPSHTPSPADPSEPVPDDLKRKSVLAVLDVANLRRNSAIAWIATWVVFLLLVALSYASVGGEFGYVSVYSLVYTGGMFLLVPAAVSIIIGFFSSLHWGQEYRDLVGDTRRLPLAWLPGIRGSKAAWNRSRSFLWLSWALGMGVVVGALWGLSLASAYASTHDAGAEAILAALVVVILAFLFTRGLHHFYFARSVVLAGQEMLPALGPQAWAHDQVLWVIAAFALPFDPVFLYLLTLFSGAGQLPSSQFYAAVLGATTIGGVISMGASALLAVGYWRVGNACRHWLRAPQGPTSAYGAAVPPEWIQG